MTDQTYNEEGIALTRPIEDRSMGLSETVSLLCQSTTLAEVLEALEKKAEAPKPLNVISLCEVRRRRRVEQG